MFNCLRTSTTVMFSLKNMQLTVILALFVYTLLVQCALWRLFNALKRAFIRISSLVEPNRGGLLINYQSHNKGRFQDFSQGGARFLGT